MNNKVIERRRRTKRRAVEYLGGKCERCGYAKCFRALTFHHRDPKTKLFGLSISSTRSWEKIRAELDKCDLLCANCHAEVEDEIYWGVAQLVQQVAVTHPARERIAGSSPAAPANFTAEM